MKINGIDVKEIDEILDERQTKEVQLAMYYVENGNHGTDGHNRLNIIYRMYIHIKTLESFLKDTE